MTKSDLVSQIHDKKSCLCIGLDPDLSRIPKHLLKEKDPVFAFNRAIIDATQDICVAYKPNMAFYEALGSKGWESLEKTMDYLPSTHFTIADAKRGDVGNTTLHYAKAFFEHMDFDAVTISPYMGRDSIQPFLKYENKWCVVLALTSNASAADYQFNKLPSGEMLFEQVIKSMLQLPGADRLMFVLGATNTHYLQRARACAPNSFFLVPGVGVQGGSASEVIRLASNSDIGLLINVSRGIIYAGQGHDFDQKAREAALAVNEACQHTGC